MNRTAVSLPSTTSSVVWTRRCCCTATSIRRPSTVPMDASGGRLCATSSAATCSPSNRARQRRVARRAVVPRETGFPRADVENDFLRVRRRQFLAKLARKLRGGPDDVNLVLPFDEVVKALGYEGER